MPRVLIVDDHSVVRVGIRQIIMDLIPDVTVYDVETGDKALAEIRSKKMDCVILDLSLKDKSGLDVLKEIKQEKPELPVLILTMYPEDQFATRVLRAGASGYVTKQSAPEELSTAVKKVLAGGTYVSQALGEQLASKFFPGKQQPHETLSDREHQVFLMIASGKSATEIGKKLHLSVKTISTYQARILEKMGMAKNVEIIQYAVQNKLI